MPNDYIGMNIHLPQLDVLEKIDEANIAWVRVDFNWSAIEETRGVFDYSNTDRVFRFCEARGIQIFPTLAYTPGWANDEKGENYPPNSMAPWLRFVKNVMRRYGRYIKYWGVWNEPNVPKFFSGTMREYFSDILWYAWFAVRSINRELDLDMKIVAPNISVSDDFHNWPNWFEACERYQHMIDIISFHCYAPTGKDVAKYIKDGRWPSYMKWIRPLLDRWYPHKQAIIKSLEPFAEGQKFWLCETGWSTHVVSEAEQMMDYQYLINDDFTQVVLDRIFFYEFQDDIRFDPRFGIVKSDLTRKMTYTLLRGL